MDLYTLFNNAVTAAAGESDLAAYCQTHYGRGHQVKTDPPMDGLPGEDACPYVILHSPMKDAGQRKSQITYGFAAAVFIYEPDEAVRVEDNVQESEGTEILLTIADYVKEAVRGVIPVNFAMSYSLDTDTVSLFPLMSAELAFEFVETVTIGTAPLA